MSQPQTLATGFVFGESPRWHEGRIWFSDFGAREIIAVDLHGNAETMLRTEGTPMGLGFLPDGRLLVVSADDGRLLRREHDGTLVVHADLSQLSSNPWNDLVVDGRGNAYVGNLGFDFSGEEFAPGILALVRPDGSIEQVADGCAFANGMVVSADNATLILAETYASQLTAFDIDATGRLSSRRVWAGVEGSAPDGIFLDADGAVWFADVPNRRCVRIREGGEVLQSIELDRGCFACALGGPDGSTLFLTAAIFPPSSWGPDAERTGQILSVPAPAPHAGWS